MKSIGSKIGLKWAILNKISPAYELIYFLDFWQLLK